MTQPASESGASPVARAKPSVPPSRWLWATLIGVGLYLAVSVGLSFVLPVAYAPGLIGVAAGSYVAGRYLPARGWGSWLGVIALVFVGSIATGVLLLLLVFAL